MSCRSNFPRGRVGRRLLASFLLALVVLLGGSSPASAADNRISRIDISIELATDGSALVTETWQAQVRKGTEVYLVKDHLSENQMAISDLAVRDDSGRVYQTIPTWNPSASFADKSYRAGYYRKGSEVQLCFGISEYGSRTYTISYRMTNFVVRYADGVDGFNIRVVNDQMSAPPESVKVMITKSGTEFGGGTRVWAFGFVGEIQVAKGQILAQSSKSLGRSNYVNVLASFGSGTFQPVFTAPESFAAVQERALKDSEYENSWLKWWRDSDQEIGITVGALILTFLMTMGGLAFFGGQEL